MVCAPLSGMKFFPASTLFKAFLSLTLVVAPVQGWAFSCESLMGGDFREGDYLAPTTEVSDVITNTPWSREALEAPAHIETNPIYLRYVELKEKAEAGTATEAEAAQWEGILSQIVSRNVGLLNRCFYAPERDACLKEHAELMTDELLDKGISPREMEFLVGLKAFLKAQIIAQGFEIQKKIDCVNAALKAGGYIPEVLKNVSLNARCGEFLNTDLREMVKGYREIRVYLGLMQSAPRMLVHPRNGTLRGDDWDGTRCGLFENPLAVDGTPLCTEKLGEIVRINPKHTVVDHQFRKINNALEKLGIYEDLPEVPRLTPLTVEELAIAAAYYRESYIKGATMGGNYQPDAWSEIQELGAEDGVLDPVEQWEERQKYIRIKTAMNWAMYLNTLRFRGKMGTLSNMVLPEDSEFRVDDNTDTAEKRYTDWISRHPAIAFMQPEEVAVDALDCSQPVTVGRLQVNLGNVCEAYKARMESKGYPLLRQKFFERDDEGKIISHRPVLQAALKAFEKSRAVHQLMLKRFDADYDTQQLLADMKSGQVTQMNDIKKWLPLMANEFAVKGFLEIEPDYKAVSERLHKEHEDSEFNKMLWELAGAVGLGIGCIALLGTIKFMPLACLLGGGIGVNSYFYHTGYKRYQAEFIRFFSSTSGDLRLIDLEVVEDEDFGMFLETAFFGLGLETGRVVMAGKQSWRDLGHYSQLFKQSFSRAEP